MIPRGTPIGTIVVGNEEADENYGITTQGTQWVYVGHESDHLIVLRSVSKHNIQKAMCPETFKNKRYDGDRFDVFAECFDLLHSDNEAHILALPIIDELLVLKEDAINDLRGSWEQPQASGTTKR